MLVGGIHRRRLTQNRRTLLAALILGGSASYADAVATTGPAHPASQGYPAGAGPVNFDSSFFPAGMAPRGDLSRFDKSGYVTPGTYRGDVLLNKVWRGRDHIVFANVQGTDDSAPCYDAAALTRYGIDLPKLAADVSHQERKPIPEGMFCGDIGDYIPDATATFDANDQSLSLSVPQVYALRNARGYVDPSQWDAGIHAGVLGYNTNFYRSGQRGGSQSSAYLGLNVSMHLGSWHVYHLGSLNWVQGIGKRYQNSATYLQHDVPSWRAQMLVGDTFTSGDIFDSVRLRGARLFTDDRMLPQSLQGYAPVVRGVAETNARVVIRQNGYVIYDTTMAPGPFVIDDLYPTGYGGDLDVEVTEADGRVRRFSQPFSAVQQLLRPGQDRWSIAAGKVKQLNPLGAPMIVQGTYQRGLSNLFTGYSGGIVGSGYRSALAGIALNTPMGAVSTDLTYANNHVPGRPSTSGLSVRVGYNKNITETGTHVGIAAYRYSTGGFVGLADAVSVRNAGYESGVMRQHSRVDVTLNQFLGKDNRYGQIYLNGSIVDYWNNSGRQVNFTAGYSNNWKSLSYSISAQRTRDSINPLSLAANAATIIDVIPGTADAFLLPTTPPIRRDTQVFLNLALPLGRANNALMFSSAISHSSNGRSNEQATLTGRFGSQNRVSYGATLGRAGSSTSTGLHGQYMGDRGNVAGSFSYGNGYRQTGLGASGTVVVHAGGATFAPPAGDTIGLIYAPGATGAQVGNTQGAVVDKRGYAVVPYLTPYQLNAVALDPKGTDASVELKESSQNVAPRAGSVVRLKYEVDSSSLLLIDTQLSDGRPVPFGADVLDEDDNNVGLAGQAGRLMVRGVDDGATLTVRWGAGEQESCQMHVERLPEHGQMGDLVALQGSCIGPSDEASTSSAP